MLAPLRVCPMHAVAYLPRLQPRLGTKLLLATLTSYTKSERVLCCGEFLALPTGTHPFWVFFLPTSFGQFSCSLCQRKSSPHSCNLVQLERLHGRLLCVHGLPSLCHPGLGMQRSSSESHSKIPCRCGAIISSSPTVFFQRPADGMAADGSGCWLRRRFAVELTTKTVGAAHRITPPVVGSRRQTGNVLAFCWCDRIFSQRRIIDAPDAGLRGEIDPRAPCGTEVNSCKL